MVEALQAIEVPYALVGGMALAFHEVVRATEKAEYNRCLKFLRDLEE